MLAEVPTHEDQARKWVSTWSEERCIVRHRWISQDGKACLLASWFLSRDVAVHSGVVGASAPAPRCFKFRRKTRPGDPGGTTTADATVWQNPCSAAGGLCVVGRVSRRAPWTPRIEPGRGPRAGASGTQDAHTTIRLCVRLRPVPIRIPFSRRCSTPHPPAPHPPPHPPGGRGSSSHSSHRGERIRMSVKCYI